MCSRNYLQNRSLISFKKVNLLQILFDYDTCHGKLQRLDMLSALWLFDTGEIHVPLGMSTGNISENLEPYLLY